MTRPRWHDVAIIAAITSVLAVGVWALWWDDVRGWLGIERGDVSGALPPPPPASGT